MSVTSISRDLPPSAPCIVRLEASNTLAQITASGYLTAQADNINTLNNGEWTWLATDMVAVSASDGFGLFSVTSDFASLVYVPSSANVEAQVALTAAQWNGMYAAPVALIAAPGANKMIIVDKLSLAMTFVSAQYAAGGAVAAQYENTVHGAGVAATATIAAATINGLAASTVENLAGAASIVYAAAVNQGLYLSNATGAFTTGDSTWVVTVNYHIIATA